MTRSTVKKLAEPLEEPKRELHRCRKAATRQQQNESLAIGGRNLFDDEASSFVNFEPKAKHLGFTRYLANPRPDGAKKDESRLRFFHFTLKGKAKEWLDKMLPAQITTWEQLVCKFLDQFFPPGRALIFRDMIIRFREGINEPIKGLDSFPRLNPTISPS
ncbi:DNA-directed DNA polymerase [Tanacetum coccineum]